MSFTTNLGLALIAAGAGAEALANQTFQELDALVNCCVNDRDLSTPGAVVDGDRFIVKPTGTGAWDTHDNEIAHYVGGEWLFYAPQVGWTAWVEDESVVVRWDGTSWVSVTGESIFAGRRTTSNQSAGTGSWTAVQWNAETRKDAIYTHDNSTNPDQIVLAEAGDYEVSADLTIEASGTAGLNRVDAKLTLGGSDVAGSFAALPLHVSNFPRSTMCLRQVITATAGAVLRVEVQRQSGSSTVNLIADWCRVGVRRV